LTGSETESRLGMEDLLRIEDLLRVGTLKEEAKFDGPLANETVLLCYSSGTTGKPKGVEVRKNIL
jgi:4-coumarate--CoA ligase